MTGAEGGTAPCLRVSEPRLIIHRSSLGFVVGALREKPMNRFLLATRQVLQGAQGGSLSERSDSARGVRGRGYIHSHSTLNTLDLFS